MMVTDCDLDWVLLNNPNPMVENAVVMHTINGDMGSTIQTAVLAAGQEYYLVVIINSQTAFAATYEVSIVQEK